MVARSSGWSACSCGALIIVLPEPAKRPLVPGNGWIVSGGMFENDRPQRHTVSPEIVDTARPRVSFRSWSPETDSATGRVETIPFSAPLCLAVPISGSFRHKDIGLYLERISTGERLEVATESVHQDWSERSIWLPLGWSGRQIRLVAESRTRDQFLCVGTPFKVSPISCLKESVFVLLALHAVGAVLIVLPGLAAVVLGRRLFRKWSLDSAWVLPTAFIAGYIAFFVCYYGGRNGRVACSLMWVVWLATAVAGRRELKDFMRATSSIRTPVVAGCDLIAVLCVGRIRGRFGSRPGSRIVVLIRCTGRAIISSHRGWPMAPIESRRQKKSCRVRGMYRIDRHCWPGGCCSRERS